MTENNEFLQLKNMNDNELKEWQTQSVKHKVAMVLKCGTTEYKFNVNVTESGIDLGEATSGLVLKLTAAGRSNAESSPAEWWWTVWPAMSVSD